MKTPKRYSPAIERRILKAYYEANSQQLHDGLNWYSRANATCVLLAENYGISLSKACAVVSAISPGCAWENNADYAETIIRDYNAGLRGKQITLVGTYGWANVRKCERILSGELPANVIVAPKTLTFYLNLLHPGNLEHVTIDSHAICLALGIDVAKAISVKAKPYQYLANHYRKAAIKAKVTPNQIQAVTWIVCKYRLHGPSGLPNTYPKRQLDTVPF